MIDMMSGFSVQRIQLSADPEDWSWIKWYAARPEARPTGFMHSFCFPLWDDARNQPAQGPQIHLLPSQFRGRDVSPFSGQATEGPLEYWQNGVPRPRAGPDAFAHCGATYWQHVGEVPPGGSHEATLTDAYRVGSGGQQQGGYAVAQAPQSAWGSGGQAQGGYVSVVAPSVASGSGGQAVGGSAAMTAGSSFVGAGGQQQGGAAPHTAGSSSVGSGGQRQGGTAPYTAGSSSVGSGGQQQGGYAATARGVVASGSGGQSQGGAATALAFAAALGEGGQLQGGTAGAVQGVAYFGSGGQSQGGTATATGGEMNAGYILGTSFVVTSEATGAPPWVDLATVQSITFSLPAAQKVFIAYSAVAGNNTAGAINFLGVNVDGAVSAQLQFQHPTANAQSALAGGYTATLAAGAHTIKLQFGRNAGTSTFSQRSMTVWAA